MLNEGTFNRALTVAVLLGSLITLSWGIWSVPILSHNEARRMVVVQEMSGASGQLLLPTKNGELYVTKPPLFYWLAFGASRIFRSTAEWVLRLPSVVSALLVLALFHRRVQRYFNRRTALFTSLILLTSESFTCYARRAEIEMLLTLTGSVALLFFFDYLQTKRRDYLLASYVLLGLAFLTKGPVALLFFIPPVAAYAFFYRDRQALAGLFSGWGWLLLLLVALPWFVATLLLLGPAPFLEVLETDVAGKVAATTNADPWYNYLLFLAGAFAPWLIALPFFRPKASIARIAARREGGFFALAFLAPLVLMSLIGEKHGKYLLPCFPFLAVCLACWLDDFCAVWIKQAPRLAYRSILGGAITLLCGYFLYYAAIEPRLYSHRFSTLLPLVTTIKEIRGKASVFLYQDEMIQLIYYFGRPMPIINTGEVTQRLGESQTFLLVADNRFWGELDKLELCVIKEFSPFIKSNREARLYGTGDLCRERTAGLGR